MAAPRDTIIAVVRMWDAARAEVKDEGQRRFLLPYSLRAVALRWDEMRNPCRIHSAHRRSCFIGRGRPSHICRVIGRLLDMRAVEKLLDLACGNA